MMSGRVSGMNSSEPSQLSFITDWVNRTYSLPLVLGLSLRLEFSELIGLLLCRTSCGVLACEIVSTGAQRLNLSPLRLAALATLSSPAPRCCWTIWDNSRLSRSCCFSSSRCARISSLSISDIWRRLGKQLTVKNLEAQDYIPLPVALIFIFPF